MDNSSSFFAARIIKDELARQGAWRCLSLVGALLNWVTESRSRLSDLDERMIEQFLQHRARKQAIQPGDKAALRRWLSVLRAAGVIAPAVSPPITLHELIFQEYAGYLRRERGLALRSIIRHLPAIRRFLREVCPAGAGDLGKINQGDIVRYAERHASDGSAESAKAMCWSLRAFLR